MDRDVSNREGAADAKSDIRDVRWQIPHYFLGIPNHSEPNSTLFLVYQLS